MGQPDIKVISAWRKNLVRQLKQGKSLTESARLLGVGRSKVHQEFRRDPQFKEEVEGLVGHPINSIISNSY